MEQPHYPLSQSIGDALQAASGRQLAEINSDSAGQGLLDSADLQISPETLRMQAEIAQRSGFAQLAENLLRAAELTAVPNEVLLQMYDTLRPGRASFAELEALADSLQSTYNAPQNAAFVREAAAIYRERKLTKT